MNTIKTSKFLPTKFATSKNSDFIYTGGADVMSTWKKTGWTPPSEYRDDYLFKKNRDTHG